MKRPRPIHRIEPLEARIAPAFAAVELLPSSGLQFNPTFDAVGGVVGPAGDVNGDGLDDLVISAGNDSYVLFGESGPVSTPVDLTKIDGSNGFRIPQSGGPAAAGDINDDGFDDVLIRSGPTGGGASYVILGHAEAFRPSIDLLSLDGESGFAITSDNSLETRRAVGAAGDVNGDGLADMLIGASDTSSAYVIFGRADFSEGVNLSSLDATDGFKIEGSVQFEHLGEGVSSAGDVNNDGFDDVLLNTSTNSSY